MAEEIPYINNSFNLIEYNLRWLAAEIDPRLQNVKRTFYQLIYGLSVTDLKSNKMSEFLDTSHKKKRDKIFLLHTAQPKPLHPNHFTKDSNFVVHKVSALTDDLYKRYL